MNKLLKICDIYGTHLEVANSEGFEILYVVGKM